MNPTERAFRADICAHPRDDAPRLIYADWLEDQGRPHLAEFIREQIRGDGIAFGAFVSAYRDFVAEVLEGNPSWRLLGFDTDIEDTRMPRLRFGYKSTGQLEDYGWLLFRRGLVHEVRLSCAEYLRTAAWLFTVQPVRRVILLDRRPSQDRLRHWTCGFTWVPDASWHKAWYTDVPECLPRSLYDGVQAAYQSRRVAWDEHQASEALSRACVQRGREWAARS